MTPILAYFAVLILLATGIPDPSMMDGVSDEEDLSSQMKALRETVSHLSRQVMLQQLFVEERIRSDADSGIKQVRHTREGTRNYYGNTHTSMGRTISIHDHANNIRTVGLGEFVAVLNGVEFRTRHNDYRLFMPHTTSDQWHDVEPIPFPKAPPEVTSLEPDDQVAEMQEWFKAWQNQDHSQRDYRKYFKPVLCYMEGAWTMETEGSIDEPFKSDRLVINYHSFRRLTRPLVAHLFSVCCTGTSRRLFCVLTWWGRRRDLYDFCHMLIEHQQEVNCYSGNVLKILSLASIEFVSLYLLYLFLQALCRRDQLV